jgi:hypothetical protein
MILIEHFLCFGRTKEAIGASQIIISSFHGLFPNEGLSGDFHFFVPVWFYLVELHGKQ